MLRIGMKGERVKDIQQALQGKGFNPGAVDGVFGVATKAAVVAFQQSRGLLPDGIVGPQTLHSLGLETAAADQRSSAINLFDLQLVANIFFDVRLDSIKQNLPLLLAALEVQGLVDEEMILMALATIRVEAPQFEPVAEAVNLLNTSPGGAQPFDLYDFRSDLGNSSSGDGQRYRGRGFVGLRGKTQYAKFDLLDRPDEANQPEQAAQILAACLKEKERIIRQGLLEEDWFTCRRSISGNTTDLEVFINAYTMGDLLLQQAKNQSDGSTTTQYVMMPVMANVDWRWPWSRGQRGGTT